MKKIVFVIFLSSLYQQSHAQTFNANLALRLQTTLDSLVNLFANTKGMAASVYYPGQGIWKGASGLSYAGQPINSNMEFGLASNSKLFTAVIMLKLAENNILSLEDSLHEWIPNYLNINPNITIRQLLNHTSGVSDPFFTTALLDSVKAHPTHAYTVNEVLSWVGPPQFNPGTGYGYSNINYILAGMVAKSATGFNISQIIRDSILTPLQLDSTFFDIEEPEVGMIAHRWEDGIDLHDTSRISLSTSGGPAGAMFSTVAEMAQWYHALMDGQILSPASFAEMTTFALPGNYGLGLGLFTFFGNTCWGHGGITVGYKTRMIYDPCMKAAVCGLSNSNPSAVDGITALLYKVLVDYLPKCAGPITGLNTVCQGQNTVVYSVPLIANATSYSWTLPIGAIGVSNTNSITVNYGLAAVSGNISVKGINSYGEGMSSSLAITVNQVSASNTSESICANQTPFVWNGLSLDTSGQYDVMFTNIHGCDSTATLHLTVFTPTSSNTNLTLCDAQTPFLWNGLSLDTSGTYQVQLNDVNGCDSLSTLHLTIVPCGACPLNVTINTSPFQVPITESQTWIMTSGTVMIPTGANVKFDADTSGFVLLSPGFMAESGSVFVAQAYNGCTVGEPQLPQERSMSEVDLLASNEIILYPNPTTGMIHLQHDDKIQSIQIYNMVGKMLINHHCEGEFASDIDLSSLANGIYYVKAIGYQSIKLIKND